MLDPQVGLTQPVAGLIGECRGGIQAAPRAGRGGQLRLILCMGRPSGGWLHCASNPRASSFHAHPTCTLPQPAPCCFPAAGETYVGPDPLLGAAAAGTDTAPLIAGLVHLDADTVAAAALDGVVAAQSIEGLAPAAAPSPAGSLDPVVNQVRSAWHQQGRRWLWHQQAEVTGSCQAGLLSEAVCSAAVGHACAHL